jgi:hypothetical protein
VSSDSLNDGPSDPPATKDKDGATSSSGAVGDHGAIFIYITADKDFHKPALSALGSKSHAEVLQGKLFRKTGSCLVLPLSESCTHAWASQFYPAPSLHTLYRRHPFRDGRYIGVRHFHSVIFDEKRYVKVVIIILRSISTCKCRNIIL